MNQVLLHVPEMYRTLYQRHWVAIKADVKHGKIKDVYNYPLLDDSEIMEKVQEVIKKYDSRIKVNLSFGVILKHKHRNDLKFYEPCITKKLFQHPQLLASAKDCRQFIDNIDREDLFEYARLHRSSTKWTAEEIVCVRFEVYKLQS